MRRLTFSICVAVVGAAVAMAAEPGEVFLGRLHTLGNGG
jgi:hypothetical protein